jgi:cytochrome c biogenesis protein CcmG/thiol:disulfide interchange protein DsbE
MTSEPTTPKGLASFLTSRWVLAIAVAAAIVAWPLYLTHRTKAAPPTRLNYVLKDTSGRDVRLADYTGRPLVLNFWATWCGPCKLEVPWFVEFSNKYRDKSLTVIGISVDDPPADILKFSGQYKVNYPMLVGKGHEDLMTAYQAEDVIPISWLIRKDGSVYAKVEGIHPVADPKAWLESQIQALF